MVDIVRVNRRTLSQKTQTEYDKQLKNAQNLFKDFRKALSEGLSDENTRNAFVKDYLGEGKNFKDHYLAEKITKYDVERKGDNAATVEDDDFFAVVEYLTLEEHLGKLGFTGTVELKNSLKTAMAGPGLDAKGYFLTDRMGRGESIRFQGRRALRHIAEHPVAYGLAGTALIGTGIGATTLAMRVRRLRRSRVGKGLTLWGAIRYALPGTSLPEENLSTIATQAAEITDTKGLNSPEMEDLLYGLKSKDRAAVLERVRARK